MVTALHRRPRPPGRHVHEPAPRVDQRADLPQRRADLRRRSSRGCSPTWPASSRSSTSAPSLLRAPRRRPPSAGSPTRPSSAAVVEVGLLGRYDATNVVDAEVAVLTNVGLDHTDGVGDWRRRVAEEKAGIVKPGSTFVLGETDPELAEVFAATRRRRSRGGATRTSAARRTGSRSVAGCSTCAPPARSYDEVFLPLHGAAPGRQRRDRPGGGRRRSSIGRSTPSWSPRRSASVRTPGRFEVVGREPARDPRRRPQPRRARRPLAATLDEGFVAVGDATVRGRRARRVAIRVSSCASSASADAVEVVCCPIPRARRGALPAGELGGIVAGSSAGGAEVVARRGLPRCAPPSTPPSRARRRARHAARSTPSAPPRAGVSDRHPRPEGGR